MVLTSPSLPTDKRRKKSRSKLEVVRNFFKFRKSTTTGTSDVFKDSNLGHDSKYIDKDCKGNIKLLDQKKQNGLRVSDIASSTGMDIKFGVDRSNTEINGVKPFDRVSMIEVSDVGNLSHEFCVKVRFKIVSFKIQ